MARNRDGSNVGPWREYDDCEACNAGLRFNGKCNNCGDVRRRPQWSSQKLMAAIAAGAARVDEGLVADPDWANQFLEPLSALALALQQAQGAWEREQRDLAERDFLRKSGVPENLVGPVLAGMRFLRKPPGTDWTVQLTQANVGPGLLSLLRPDGESLVVSEATWAQIDRVVRENPKAFAFVRGESAPRGGQGHQGAAIAEYIKGAEPRPALARVGAEVFKNMLADAPAPKAPPEMHESLARLIEEANAVINNASYEPDGPFENGGHHKVETLEALASATADAEKALGRHAVELLRPRRQLDHEGPGWIDLDGFIRLFSPQAGQEAVLIVRGNPNSPGAVARSLTPGEEAAIVACWAADLRRRKVIP